MSNFKSKQQFLRRRRSPSRMRNPQPGRLSSLVMRDGQIEITILEGQMPQVIVDANIALKEGRAKDASEILNEKAIDEIRQSLRGDESDTLVMLALGKLLFDLDQWSRAEEWYRKICELEPHAFAFDAMAEICFSQSRLFEAAEYRKKAVELDRDDITYWQKYAKDLIRIGKRREGIELFRKRVERAPEGDYGSFSAFLWNLHYFPESTTEMFCREYKRWGETYFPISMAKTSHGNNPDPNRRLRIAYISPDFRLNVVSRSFEPLLDGHDRENFEVFGYSKVVKPDKITERFKRKFDQYRDVSRINPSKASDLIVKDKIDILIEVGGHCCNTGIDVLAFKPAPVQVDFGGINTSGMRQIDYRLTDRILTPTHMEKYYVEESVFLDSGFFSYRPPRNSPLVGPLPAKKKGYVTFGSFNNSVKIDPYVMELWARILKANENSRLLLKFHCGSDKGMQNFYLGEFERLGISRNRIDIFETFHSHFEYMNLYNQVDLVLDTYPYNGCITTIEGLWMGVPTLSLFGRDLLVSRSGLSILSQIGLEIFAARNAEEYVAKANAFVRELDNLEKIRGALRQMMLNSNLCNPKKHAHNLEKAYRMMWHRWCAAQSVSISDEHAKSQTISSEVKDEHKSDVTVDVSS